MPEHAGKPVSRRTSWLIWGTVTLLAALVLGTALGLAINAWYIQRNNEAWCRFYSATTQKVLITDRALYTELETAKHEQGCH